MSVQNRIIDASIEVFNKFENFKCAIHGVTPKRISVWYVDKNLKFTVYTCCEESELDIDIMFKDFEYPVDVRFVKRQQP